MRGCAGPHPQRRREPVTLPNDDQKYLSAFHNKTNYPYAPARADNQRRLKCDASSCRRRSAVASRPGPMACAAPRMRRGVAKRRAPGSRSTPLPSATTCASCASSPARARVYAVCKGDAYGFGADLAASPSPRRASTRSPAAIRDDARAMRAAGVDLPILLYGTLAEDFPRSRRPDVIVTAHDAAYARHVCSQHDLDFSASSSTRTPPAWLRRGGSRRPAWPRRAASAGPRARRVHAPDRHRHRRPRSPRRPCASNAMAARLDAAGWRKRERMVASSRVMLRSAGAHLRRGESGSALLRNARGSLAIARWIAGRRWRQ